MLSHLADVSIRSLALAVAAAMALWIARGRKTAAFEHALWAAVVCGMLAFFAFGQALPRLPWRILDSAPVHVQPAPPAKGATLPLWDLPTGAVSRSARARGRFPISWNELGLLTYAATVLLFLARFATGMFLVRKLVATARSVDAGVYESDLINIPCAVGCVRARILLPPGWREWSREKLDAVLAHEGAHVQRRDCLVAFLAGLNRCLFWFHPLAWVLERKLARLADQACDEYCVAALGDREGYARLLLEMAAGVDPSLGRLRRHALTMAAGSHMRQRIESLLVDGRSFSRGLSRAAWAGIALCGIPVVWAAGGIEVSRQPAALALAMPRVRIPAPPVLAQVQATAPDVVTIKPCGPNDGAGHSGRGGAGGRGFGTDPGRLWVNCLSTWEIMDIAYAQFPAEPLLNASELPMIKDRLRGGPEWIYSDYYSLDAITSNPAANVPKHEALKTWAGPMLRTLLEDRFQVKVHREVEQVPMYALTIAPGGLKLEPMQSGACIPIPPGGPYDTSQMFPPGQKPQCINHLSWDGPNWKIDAAGKSMPELALMLSMAMNRHVLDQTGITAPYLYHLVFAHDATTPGTFPDGMPDPFPPSDLPPGPTIFAALEQVGLQLQPVTGPREYLVIDQVSRPN